MCSPLQLHRPFFNPSNMPHSCSSSGPLPMLSSLLFPNCEPYCLSNCIHSSCPIWDIFSKKTGYMVLAELHKYPACIPARVPITLYCCSNPATLSLSCELHEARWRSLGDLKWKEFMKVGSASTSKTATLDPYLRHPRDPLVQRASWPSLTACCRRGVRQFPGHPWLATKGLASKDSDSAFRGSHEDFQIYVLVPGHWPEVLSTANRLTGLYFFLKPLSQSSLAILHPNSYNGVFVSLSCKMNCN